MKVRSFRAYQSANQLREPAANRATPIRFSRWGGRGAGDSRRDRSLYTALAGGLVVVSLSCSRLRRPGAGAEQYANPACACYSSASRCLGAGLWWQSNIIVCETHLGDYSSAEMEQSHRAAISRRGDNNRVRDKNRFAGNERDKRGYLWHR